MPSTIRHTAALLLATCLAGWAMEVAAARGILQLDGILAVRSDRSSMARLIVLPTGGAPIVREGLAGQFSLELPLDGTYLLSFEREGWVTKQIYFDTSVPVERHHEKMTFPFKVTLFPEGKDGIYAYAGPVGIVRYEHSKKDFDYEVDYTLRPGAPMADRIMALVKRMEDRGADGLPSDQGAVRYSAHVSGAGTTALEVREEPATPAATHTTAAHRTDHSPGMSREPEGPVREARAARASAARERRLPAMRVIHVAQARAQEVPVEPLPTEDLIVQRQRVITIVRVTEVTGHVSEYRRVADRSGQVVHFRDGVQIPEPVYRERTGR